MKIGLITGEYPPMQGGVGAYTQNLARALAAAGHECHIVTDRAARPPNPERKISGLSRPIDIGFARFYPHIRNWRWPMLARLADTVLQHEFDIVNIQYQAAAYSMRSPAANFIPWRLKGIAKTVVTFHDLRVPYLFPKAGVLRWQAILFMARHAVGNIATNTADADVLRAQTGKPVVEIPIGSNIQTYPVTEETILEARAKWELPVDATLLAYFGFLNESKGADTLLRAVAGLERSVHLLFVGGRTGSSDSTNNEAFLVYLDGLIGELGIQERVHWTGFVAAEMVSTYLQAADMVVMPYRDGASLRRGTLMAALAHGRPLITTAPQKPLTALRDHENCLLVPVDDVRALVAAVQALRADPELGASLGVRAAETAQRYSWDKIAGETAAFMQSILLSSST
jgi:glycosyltransferase involved in cell wall biosynthesis